MLDWILISIHIHKRCKRAILWPHSATQNLSDNRSTGLIKIICTCRCWVLFDRGFCILTRLVPTQCKHPCLAFHNARVHPIWWLQNVIRTVIAFHGFSFRKACVRNTKIFLVCSHLKSPSWANPSVPNYACRKLSRRAFDKSGLLNSDRAASRYHQGTMTRELCKYSSVAISPQTGHGKSHN